MSVTDTGLTPNRPFSELIPKLEWLMFFRVVLATFLLGLTLILQMVGKHPMGPAEEVILFALIVGTYGLTIVYGLVLRTLREHHERFAYIQLITDLFISAVLIAITGGTESVFAILYLLIVLASSILLYRRGALYTMLAATILVVLQVCREALGWFSSAPPIADDQLVNLFLNGLTHISAVFLVGLLSGYLTEQLRDAGDRLAIASRDLEALKTLNDHIITSIQSGLVSCTLERRIIFFNPAAGRITGLDPQSALYADVSELFGGFASLTAEEGGGHWEEKFKRPDGRILTLGFNVSPLEEPGGRQLGWILIFQDLTPLREMEESVRRSERFAAIGKMAAGIAHEIRNPLASMSGSIQMLARSSSLDFTEDKLMRIVLRETDRLNRLVTDFLQFARPTKPQLERLELKGVLEELILVFGYLQFGDEGSGKTPLNVSLSISRDTYLYADPRQLRQVFWNLMHNASQAMPEGGRIRLICEERGREVEVKIIDEGHGIPTDKLDRIFDPFYSTKKKGTGLGLSQVHRIVEDHNGRIFVESETGVGSTFQVILPVEAPEVTGQKEALA